MNTRDQVSITDLRGVDVFVRLSDDELEQIAKICRQRTCQAGERCAVLGEPTDDLGIVNEGKVVIELPISIPPYTQKLSVATLRRGNVFTWPALVEPHPLPASARFVEKTQIIYIKASDLERIFKERPSIECVVMKNLAIVIGLRLEHSWVQLMRLPAEMIKQGK